MSKTIINVFTINGKCQEFVVSSDIRILDLKTLITKNHQHYIKSSFGDNVKLLYKGIELSDNNDLSDYKINDKDNIQIINKSSSNPINISKSLPNSNFLNNDSVFDSYIPSPLDNNNRYSRSFTHNSPNNLSNDNLIKLLTQIDNKLDKIMFRLDKLEN